MAVDLGYYGDPFEWDEDYRMHLQADLDAAFFYIYKLDSSLAEHVLNTFDKFQRKQFKKFGSYKMKDLILKRLNHIFSSSSENKSESVFTTQPSNGWLPEIFKNEDYP
jgi:hypothetical protein